MKSPVPLPPNPAKEKTTWGAVCQQVGFADNLYRSCRDKLGSGFSPASPFGGAYDEDFEDDGDFDFDKALRKSALAVPPAPPKDWKPEEGGLLEELMFGDLPKKIALYGAGAAVLYLLYKRFMNKKPLSAPPAPMPQLSSPSMPAALPAAQVSDAAPTTVDIPASLRG